MLFQFPLAGPQRDKKGWCYFWSSWRDPGSYLQEVTSTTTRPTDALPLNRRGKWIIRSTGMWIQWPGTINPKEYKALVGANTPCTLMPSRYVRAESISISGVTEIPTADSTGSWSEHNWKRMAKTFPRETVALGAKHSRVQRSWVEVSKVVSLVQEAAMRKGAMVQQDMDGLVFGALSVIVFCCLELGDRRTSCEEHLPPCLCLGKPHGTECGNSCHPVFILVAKQS